MTTDKSNEDNGSHKDGDKQPKDSINEKEDTNEINVDKSKVKDNESKNVGQSKGKDSKVSAEELERLRDTNLIFTKRKDKTNEDKNKESKDSDKNSGHENEDKCAICMEKITDKCRSTTCRHEFCFKCLEQWMRTHGECPVCRRPITQMRHNFRSKAKYQSIPLINDSLDKTSGSQSIWRPHRVSVDGHPIPTTPSAASQSFSDSQHKHTVSDDKVSKGSEMGTSGVCTESGHTSTTNACETDASLSIGSSDTTSVDNSSGGQVVTANAESGPNRTVDNVLFHYQRILRQRRQRITEYRQRMRIRRLFRKERELRRLRRQREDNRQRIEREERRRRRRERERRSRRRRRSRKGSRRRRHTRSRSRRR